MLHGFMRCKKKMIGHTIAICSRLAVDSLGDFRGNNVMQVKKMVVDRCGLGKKR